MSKVYVPAGVPRGTAAVSVKVCVDGVGTGPTDAGLNDTHDAAAGAGPADATARWTSDTVDEAVSIRATIWSEIDEPSSTEALPLNPPATSWS